MIGFINNLLAGCIFFYLYIKPQHGYDKWKNDGVVYSSIFTSNHNLVPFMCEVALVVYSSIFTSNHNVNIEIYSLPMNYISILFYEVAFMAFLRGKYTKKILIVSVL